MYPAMTGVPYNISLVLILYTVSRTASNVFSKLCKSICLLYAGLINPRRVFDVVLPVDSSSPPKILLIRDTYAIFAVVPAIRKLKS